MILETTFKRDIGLKLPTWKTFFHKRQYFSQFELSGNCPVVRAERQRDRETE